MRSLSLDRRQLVRPGNREAAGRVAEPRPESRRDHRTLGGVDARAESDLQLMGEGEVRRSLQLRRTERPVGDSARLRTQGRHQRHVHGRRV